MVAAQLQKKALERLEKIGVKDLEGKHVGLIGNGTIGSPLADLLRARGAIVTILDKDEKARGAAEKEHMKALDADDPKDRKAFFSKNDIIIGATGKCSITADDLEYLRPGAILGSASSKLVEIDIGALNRAQKGKGGPEIIDKDSFPPTVRYTLKDGRQISVLASGYPLNFDGDVVSIEPQQIQLTMGLMLIGALQATHAKAAGVHRLDPEKQLQVLRDFEEVGGVKHSGSKVAAAKSLAELKLNEMKLKHGSTSDRRHGAR
jgi:S-adenosylhomocysteine hydrolase